MLVGIRLRAYPSQNQKLTLSQWMGCARYIWNAKCEEDRYYLSFARKFTPFKNYFSSVDQEYSRFKNSEISPWLSQCPSQILRNTAANWKVTYQKFIDKKCGRPKRKKKTDKGSIHLTRELFRFEKDSLGRDVLFIGTKTNNIGYLRLKLHGKFNTPKSLYVRKERGQYFVSFCYEDDSELGVFKPDEHLDFLRGMTHEQLKDITVGIDRGVVIPVQAGEKKFDFSQQQKNHLSKADLYIKRLQRKLARQQKGSNRRAKTKHRIAKHHAKKSNIRIDFAHKTSHALVNSESKVFIFEKLNTKNMTKKPAPKKDEHGNFIPNKAKAKAGLNKAILNVGWYRISSFLTYKANKLGKAVFSVKPAYTSQECASCGHTHPDNRKTQSSFLCVSCGHNDNADHNASIVIRNRGIKAILDTGTVLDEHHLGSSSGRGGSCKTIKRGKPFNRNACEASKETITT